MLLRQRSLHSEHHCVEAALIPQGGWVPLLPVETPKRAACRTHHHSEDPRGLLGKGKEATARLRHRETQSTAGALPRPRGETCSGTNGGCAAQQQDCSPHHKAGHPGQLKREFTLRPNQFLPSLSRPVAYGVSGPGIRSRRLDFSHSWVFCLFVCFLFLSFCHFLGRSLSIWRFPG